MRRRGFLGLATSAASGLSAPGRQGFLRCAEAYRRADDF
jgi:hypothetical protein